MRWTEGRVLGNASHRAKEAVIKLVVVTTVFGLYLATLSRHYSADSLLLALQIEGGNLSRFLDPTHVLLQPVGYAWFQLWRFAGWSHGSIVPLQVVNALGGAVCVGLLYGIMRPLTGSRRIPCLASAGFAVSGGLWLLSVEAEFVTIGLAPSLFVLWLLLSPPERLRSQPWYGLALGAAVSLAILTYLSSAILIPVVAAGLLLQTLSSGKRPACGCRVTSWTGGLC